MAELTPAPTILATRPPSFADANDEDNKKDAYDDRTVEDEKTVEDLEVQQPKDLPAGVHDIGAAPDGGFAAWSVVAGVACAGFCTIGFANAFGVFQAYYTETIPGATQFSIAWIGSLQYCLIFLPGVPSGHLVDSGHFKIMSIIASAVLVTSIFLVAECKTIWQLVLCQGIAIGGSSGFIFIPSLVMIPHWFDKKRATAYGILTVGSSTGGAILPIVVRKLLAAVGYKWTIRTLGFIMGVFLVIFCLVVRPRVPIKKTAHGFPIRDVLRNKANVVYTIGGTLLWFGIYVPLGFFDVYAQSIGIPKTRSYYPIVTSNACSLLGRVGGGMIADKLGVMNVLTAFCAATAIISIFWPFAESFATLEVVTVIYGISSGVFAGLLPAPTAKMVPRHQIGASVGFAGTCMSIGALVGIPIAGQILEDSGGFKAVGGYAGGITLFACLFLLWARRIGLGHWWGKY